MTWRVFWTWGPCSHQREFAAPGEAEAFAAQLRTVLPADLLTVSMQQVSARGRKPLPAPVAGSVA